MGSISLSLLIYDKYNISRARLSMRDRSRFKAMRFNSIAFAGFSDK